MNVLILTVTYYPEQKSASFMLKTLAEELASLENKVTVITFSSDIDHEFTNEIINGVELIRIKVGNPGYSRIKRALIELSYSWRIKSFLKKSKGLEFDGVIYYSPSIFFGEAIKYIKKRWSVPSYLIVRDLFPDWVVRVGQMKKGPIYWFFKYFEKLSFDNANFIGMESHKDISYGVDLVEDPDISVEHLHNWYSEPKIIDKQNFDEILSKRKLNLVYGGALGVAQDISGFLKAIESIEENNIRVIIVGDGEKRTEIEGIIKDSELDVDLFPMLDRNKYLALVEQCDIGLVVLDKNLVSNNYPAKSFDYMFFSKPIFSYMNSGNEFGKMIEDLDFGYFVQADVEGSLQSEILEVLDGVSIKRKGIKSKQVLKDHFSANKAANKIIESLKV